MTVTGVLIGIVVVLISTILFFLYRILTYWQRKGIPHEKPHLIYGNMVGVKKTLCEMEIYRIFYDKYRGKAPFMGFYFYQQPMAFVTDLTVAKNILTRDFPIFNDRVFYYNDIYDPLSAHLFALDNPKWKSLRKRLTPTFSSAKIKYMFNTVKTVGDRFLNVLNGMVEEDSVVDMKEMFARFATDVIGNVAFGIECNCLTEIDAPFRRIGQKFFKELDVLNPRIAFGLGYPKLARRLGIKITSKGVSDFFMGIVKETLEYREKNNVRRGDLIDILIDLKNQPKDNVTLKEIAAQVFVYYVGGFETSSGTSSWALYELAMHQEIQNKARKEINEVLARHNNEFTYESLDEMHYLDQIIWETLRMYSVIIMVIRKSNKNYQIDGHPNFVIEKGIPTVIPSCAIHMDPDLYPNPQEFNPDNFLPENVEARPTTAMLAFGEGPRNCIGLRFGKMQLRLALAMLLRAYKFSITSRTQVPPKFDIKSNMCTSEKGIYLKVEKI